MGVQQIWVKHVINAIYDFEMTCGHTWLAYIVDVSWTHNCSSKITQLEQALSKIIYF